MSDKDDGLRLGTDEPTTMRELLTQMFANTTLQQAVQAGKSVFVPFCQRCKQDYLATEEHDCVPPLSVDEADPEAMLDGDVIWRRGD
jgi:hypothetical protein